MIDIVKLLSNELAPIYIPMTTEVQISLHMH